MNEKKISEHSPDKYWHNWTKSNLPKNDFYITDIDNCIRSKSGDFIIIELKRYSQPMSTSQKITYNLLNKVLEDANGKSYPININGFNTTTTLSYKGFYLIQFERTSFEDGKVYVNGVESSEMEVINLLSFQQKKDAPKYALIFKFIYF